MSDDLTQRAERSIDTLLSLADLAGDGDEDTLRDAAYVVRDLLADRERLQQDKIDLAMKLDAAEDRALIGETYLQRLREERDAALHCQSAYGAITRAIAEAVGSGDPSGPYWEDGVRWLQQRAEAAEATLTRLRALVEKWHQRANTGFDPEESAEVTDFWNGARQVADELLAELEPKS